MPNKAYWKMLEDIMEATTTICEPALEQKDEEEAATLLEDIRSHKEEASEVPSEEITLAGLAGEFIQVFGETCENYRHAETAQERQEILDEVKEATIDVFSCITSEFAEVFGEASRRFAEAAHEQEELFEELEESEWKK